MNNGDGKYASTGWHIRDIIIYDNHTPQRSLRSQVFVRSMVQKKRKSLYFNKNVAIMNSKQLYWMCIRQNSWDIQVMG